MFTIVINSSMVTSRLVLQSPTQRAPLVAVAVAVAVAVPVLLLSERFLRLRGGAST